MTAEEVSQIALQTGRRAVPAGPGHAAVARALAAARGRGEGSILAEGLWLNAQALEFGADIEALYVCPELVYTAEWEAVTARLIARSAETYVVSQKVYDRLSAEKADAGLLSIIRLPQWRLEDIPERAVNTVLVLDGLENPGNVGTLIRTAEGAGAGAVVLTNRRTGLMNRMTVRASLCTMLAMPVLEAGEGETADYLSSHGYTVYLGKAESQARYCDVAYAPRAAVVVGHEKYGVSQGWFQRPHVGVRIPMLGRVDSLNVAVAGGILLYEVGRQRG